MISRQARRGRKLLPSIKIQTTSLNCNYREQYFQKSAHKSRNNMTTAGACEAIASKCKGILPLQLIKGVLPFANSILLAQINSSTRSAATLINTLVDVNYLLFSSPTFCIAAAIGALDTAEEKEKIGEVVHAGWVLSGICTIPQIFIMYYNVTLLTAIGQDAALINITDDFLKIYIYAVPIVNIHYVSEQAVFATHHTMLPCKLQAISFGAWGIVSYGLTFGVMGLPELGVQGAAWAYLARAYLNFFILHASIYHLSKNDKLFSSYNIINVQPGAIERLKGIMINAATIFGLFLLETGEIYLPNIFAGMISADALAAQLIVSQYEELILFVISGIAISSQVLVANALGNKKFDNLRKIGNTGIKLSLILPLLYTLTAYSSPEILFFPFIGTSSPSNIQIIDLLCKEHILVLSGFNISMIGFRMAAAESLIGAGKSGFPMIKNMAISWSGIGLGYAFCFYGDLGLLGVNSGLAIGLCLSAMGQGHLWYTTSKCLNKELAPQPSDTNKASNHLSKFTGKFYPDKKFSSSHSCVDSVKQRSGRHSG